MKNRNFYKRNETAIIGVGCTLLGGLASYGVSWLKGRIANKRFEEREKLKWELRKDFVNEQEAKRKQDASKDPEYSQKRMDLEVKQEVFKSYQLDDLSTSEAEPLVNDRVREAIGSQPLFGNMIRLGERCVLVSSTGNGKSLLATQIALEVASGKASSLFRIDMGHQVPQRVKYFDAELLDDDRKDRYGDLKEDDVKNLDYYPDQSFRTVYYLLKKIYNELSYYGFYRNTMIVLDNIKALVPQATSTDVWYLFQALKKLQEFINSCGGCLTIIIVNHTVKNPKKNTDSDDISGAAYYSQFATRTIFIADTDVEGIKAFYVDKNRGKNSGRHYIKIVEKPYVHFEEISEKEESALTGNTSGSTAKGKRGRPVTITDDIVHQMKEMQAEGATQKAVAKHFHISEKTVSEKLNGK